MQPVISADLDTIMPRTTNQPLIVFKDTGAKPVGQQAVPNLSDNKLSQTNP